MSDAITVTKLRKNYRIHKKEPGLTGSRKGFFKRKYEIVEAVKDSNREIPEE